MDQLTPVKINFSARARHGVAVHSAAETISGTNYSNTATQQADGHDR